MIAPVSVYRAYEVGRQSPIGDNVHVALQQLDKKCEQIEDGLTALMELNFEFSQVF